MRIGFIGSGFIPKSALSSRNLQACTTRRNQRTVLTMTADKMLHAVYRVGDLDASRRFLEALGMKCLRERDVPSEKYTNVFYGYGSERKGEHFSLELTYNYGVDSYDIGTGFGHFGVAVEDAAATVQRVKAAGFKVTREVGPVKGT
ncbi:glyoxalase [Gracilaria domingensis]|nr:glyoxalase [Gracilaria domingensis]